MRLKQSGAASSKDVAPLTQRLFHLSVSHASGSVKRLTTRVFRTFLNRFSSRRNDVPHLTYILPGRIARCLVFDPVVEWPAPIRHLHCAVSAFSRAEERRVQALTNRGFTFGEERGPRRSAVIVAVAGVLRVFSKQIERHPFGVYQKVAERLGLRNPEGRAGVILGEGERTTQNGQDKIEKSFHKTSFQLRQDFKPKIASRYKLFLLSPFSTFRYLLLDASMGMSIQNKPAGRMV